MNVTIGFSKPLKKWPIFSWLVRLFDKSEFSHTYIRFDICGNSVVFEAVGLHGVRAISWTSWLQLNRPVYEFSLEIPQNVNHKFTFRVLSELSKSYGMLQILGIVISRLFKLKYNPFKNNADEQICSEYVARVLIESTLFMTNLDLDLISPANIYRKLIESGIKPIKYS